MKFLLQTVLVTLAIFMAGVALNFGSRVANPTGREMLAFWLLLVIASAAIMLVVRLEREL